MTCSHEIPLKPRQYWHFGHDNSLLWGVNLVHCRMFSGIFGLGPLGGKPPLFVVTTENIWRHSQSFPGVGVGGRRMRTAALTERFWPFSLKHSSRLSDFIVSSSTFLSPTRKFSLTLLQLNCIILNKRGSKLLCKLHFFPLLPPPQEYWSGF